MSVSAFASSVLTDELIARCGERAATYDHENPSSTRISPS